MRKVYIGYDPRDELAFRACVSSIRAYSSIDLDIIPLKDFELRRRAVYYRPYHVDKTGQRFDDRDGKPFSTEFSFTRFCIPLIDTSDEWVLFCDADMLFRADVARLFALAEDDKNIMCVHHDHTPPEGAKFDGMRQERYYRKNWSSLMLMRPAKVRLSPHAVNNQTGAHLHALLFQPDDEIGRLDESWNWLEGWSNEEIAPDVVHFTRGTPDMLGNDLPYSAEWWKAVKTWKPEMNRNSINGNY